MNLNKQMCILVLNAFYDGHRFERIGTERKKHFWRQADKRNLLNVYVVLP